MRNGIYVEEVRKKCNCGTEIIKAYKSYEGDQVFHDLTSNGEKITCNENLEGCCPKCGKPVIYNQYLIVTHEVTDSIKEKKWDVFMETGVSVSLPEYVDPETPEGNKIFKKAVINKFKEILDKNQVDFQWEEFE